MHSSAIKRYKNVSFSGCGFLGMYHVGAASCLKTYAPYLLENKVCGSSAGAITACCLLCDIPLGKFFFLIPIYYRHDFQVVLVFLDRLT